LLDGRESCGETFRRVKVRHGEARISKRDHNNPHRKTSHCTDEGK
jgi:hypothetical protein